MRKKPTAKVQKKRTPEPEPQPTNMAATPGYTEQDIIRAAQRTEIEQTAKSVAQLVADIGQRRANIKQLDTLLTTERSALATAMVNHAEAIAKLNHLALIPQPLG